MITIVTGATGFIGSWLVEELVANNDTVYLIVRNKKRLLKSFLNDTRINIIETKSINDPFLIKKLPHNADAFFHLAWAGVSNEYKNNTQMQLDNIQLAVDAIYLASSIEAKKFLAAGTVAEYVFCEGAIDINEKQSPSDIYGAAKVSAHFFLDVISRKTSQSFNWLVIPSTFGERRDDGNIIMYTIKTLLKKEKPLYGNLKQMWDFLYVSDVARAIRLIAVNGMTNKVYGIGSGIYKPLKDYIESIRDIIDPSLPLGIGEIPEMSAKTFSSCVDINSLTKDTGFIPKVSFKEGIIRTVNYIKTTL